MKALIMLLVAMLFVSVVSATEYQLVRISESEYTEYSQFNEKIVPNLWNVLNGHDNTLSKKDLFKLIKKEIKEEARDKRGLWTKEIIIFSPDQKSYYSFDYAGATKYKHHRGEVSKKDIYYFYIIIEIDYLNEVEYKLEISEGIMEMYTAGTVMDLRAVNNYANYDENSIIFHRYESMINIVKEMFDEGYSGQQVYIYAPGEQIVCGYDYAIPMGYSVSSVRSVRDIESESDFPELFYTFVQKNVSNRSFKFVAPSN